MSVAHANSNTCSHSHTDGYRDRDSHTNIDSNAHCDAYGNTNVDGYSDCNSYADSASHTYSKVCADSTAASYPRAAPVAHLVVGKPRWGVRTARSAVPTSCSRSYNPHRSRARD